MKKSTLIWIIIILLVVAAICFFTFNKENGNKNTVGNTMSNKQENNNENEQANEALANEIDNATENEISENEMENTTSSETFEEEPKTAEEKAIAIAKKDWGNNSANFSVEGIDGNGNYIVAVRDSETTALAFYTVNVNNQTFTKREMN